MTLSTGLTAIDSRSVRPCTRADADAPALLRGLLSMKRDPKPMNSATTIPIQILENLAVIALAIDMETHEVLYSNRHARDTFGDIQGEKCWRAIQKGQGAPCTACTNERLLQLDGTPRPPLRREFRSTLTCG